MELYLYRADQETGPYTEIDARALVASSQITRACLAWHEGMTEWLPLEQVITLPKPPSLPPVAAGLPPIPARHQVQRPRVAVQTSVPARSSTIRTVSGVIALILGLLAVFTIGGCINAHSKLTSLQRGDNDMDTANMFVDTMRGMSQNDPLRGVAGLMDRARSLQDDYESFQVEAWLCVVGTAVAGGVFRFSRRFRGV